VTKILSDAKLCPTKIFSKKASPGYFTGPKMMKSVNLTKIFSDK